ncbi:hypothetical protein BC834DRAFT_601071 [Gloeopeniophorella convolvens]|nr:hypothetical protein BC834DRAFT_601071 [Gloeopeniophorella convolvens]
MQGVGRPAGQSTPQPRAGAPIEYYALSMLWRRITAPPMPGTYFDRVPRAGSAHLDSPAAGLDWMDARVLTYVSRWFQSAGFRDDTCRSRALVSDLSDSQGETGAPLAGLGLRRAPPGSRALLLVQKRLYPAGRVTLFSSLRGWRVGSLKGRFSSSLAVATNSNPQFFKEVWSAILAQPGSICHRAHGCAVCCAAGGHLAPSVHIWLP